MGLRTILKTAGHWLKGAIVKVDSEIQFDTTTNPEIDSTGGDFVWNAKTASADSWKLRDPGTLEDIIAVDTQTLVKTLTLHTNYTPLGFGGADIPEIQGTTLNFLGNGNSAYMGGGVNTISTAITGMPFNIIGNSSCLGIVFNVYNTGDKIHMALYKYDYTTDIWSIASEDLTITLSVTGYVTQNFTTAAALTPGKYCIAWRSSTTAGQLWGINKDRASLRISGDVTNSINYYNMMRTNSITYSPTMPTTIAFPSANLFAEANVPSFLLKF